MFEVWGHLPQAWVRKGSVQGWTSFSLWIKPLELFRVVPLRVQEAFGERKYHLFTLERGNVQVYKDNIVGYLSGIVCLHEIYDNEYKVKSIIYVS